MSALPKRKETKPIANNIIKLSVSGGRLINNLEVKYNKDGSIDKRYCNKKTGVSSEVYPFVSEAEIKSIINVLNEHISNANGDSQKQIAYRNKMLFLIGINLGIRASDLCGLKYSFFINNNGTFKDCYKLQPKKTKKSGKYVTLYFNQTVKKAILDYVEKYPIQDMEEYLFKSRKGGAITEGSLWRIVAELSLEAGIERNIGSHSLRKTFGYWIWHNAEDKEKALVMLMTIFNHSSVAITKKYIGLMNEEIEDIFNNLNLGIDFI